MSLPDDLKYTKEHEWIKVSGAVATIGITDYAQEQLGDIVYVELPEEGETLIRHDAFGVVESVKAVSDVYAPISGKVVEVNDPLSDNPEILNEDSYGEGWMVRVEISDPSQVDDLMTPQQYAQFIKEERA